MKFLFVAVTLIVAVAAVFYFRIPTASTGFAVLSWNANTESDIAGYRIYYGTSVRADGCPPGGYSNTIDVAKTATPNKPAYTFKNLVNGTTYYFSITSYDQANNESCFSPEMKKIIAK